MMRGTRILSAAVAPLALAGTATIAAGPSKGTPDWKSSGPIAFGPDGLLLLADTKGAAVFAVETADRKAAKDAAPIQVEKINEKVASLLGTTPDKIAINDLAVNPVSALAYLSVSRGKGPAAAPALVRIDGSGEATLVSLDDVPFSKAELPNPPSAEGARNTRGEVITDLAF